MASTFAGQGMRLVLADIERDRLQAVEKEFRESGVAVTSQRVDVSRREDLDALAEHAYSEFGAVHVLCNNAGVLPPGAPCWKEPRSVWDWTMGVNFYGVLNGIQAFVPRILASGEEAHIVNTASLAGLTTRPLMSAYNVSKHAVVALSECLYAELQLTTDKVHVSLICPAFAQTRLADSTRNQPIGVNADAAASFGFFEALQSVVQNGTPPEEIAAQVLNAIHNDQFWVLTHPHLDGGVRDRFESMLARKNPQVRDLRSHPTPLL